MGPRVPNERKEQSAAHLVSEYLQQPDRVCVSLNQNKPQNVCVCLVKL